jgi:hypothetical protein
MRRTQLRVVECKHCGERIVVAGGPVNPAYVKHLAERHGVGPTVASP